LAEGFAGGSSPLTHGALGLAHGFGTLGTGPIRGTGPTRGLGEGVQMAWHPRRRYWWRGWGWCPSPYYGYPPYPPVRPPYYQPPMAPSWAPPMTSEQELRWLEEYKKDLEECLKEIEEEKRSVEEEIKGVEARIEELKRMLQR